jgi:hypothetical protein
MAEISVQDRAAATGFRRRTGTSVARAGSGLRHCQQKRVAVRSRVRGGLRIAGVRASGARAAALRRRDRAARREPPGFGGVFAAAPAAFKSR